MRNKKIAMSNTINTVTISIKEYDELRLIKKSMQDGEEHYLLQNYGTNGMLYEINPSEVIQKLNTQIDKHIRDKEELKLLAENRYNDYIQQRNLKKEYLSELNKLKDLKPKSPWKRIFKIPA